MLRRAVRLQSRRDRAASRGAGTKCIEIYRSGLNAMSTQFSRIVLFGLKRKAKIYHLCREQGVHGFVSRDIKPALNC